MAVDYNKPGNLDNYLDVLGQLRENIAEVLKMAGAGANTPTGTIRWSDGENRFEIKLRAGGWGPLRALNQIIKHKVEDSNKLNGQLASFFQDAGNLTAGTISAARLPNHSGSLITSGQIHHHDRIPNLPAAKITSGTFDTARIPALDAAKIASGTLAADRIPDTLAVRGINEIRFVAVDPDAATGRAIRDIAVTVNTAARAAVVTLTLTRVAA